MEYPTSLHSVVHSTLLYNDDRYSVNLNYNNLIMKFTVHDSLIMHVLSLSRKDNSQQLDLDLVAKLRYEPIKIMILTLDKCQNKVRGS